MNKEQLIRELPKGIIKWYQFKEGANALYVTCGMETDEIISEALSECGLQVECVAVSEINSDEIFKKYNYIVLVGALECSKVPVVMLRQLRSMLCADGRLIMGVHNRFGIRYFCGDRDPFSNRNIDGIDNYAKVSMAAKEEMKGHAYTRAEYSVMLEEAGFCKNRFYSVFPGLERAQAIYAEDYLPKEELEVRIMPQYYSPDTVFIQEEKMYKPLIENGMLHAMANGYLIECSPDGELSNVNQVTVTMDRGKYNAMATIIRRDNKVEKRALYAEGVEKLGLLKKNTEDLKSRGIAVVDVEWEGGSIVMPFVNAETATEYFRRILIEDKVVFLREMDKFWQLILNSSEHVPYEDINWEQFEPYWERRKADDPTKYRWRDVAFGTAEEQEDLGVILKKGYMDLVCLNCFYVNGEFVFFDQEFYMENVPAKVILWRTIDLIYKESPQLNEYISQMELNERYHLKAYLELWAKFSWRFIEPLRNEDELASYHQRCRRDIQVLDANRLRMNYSQDEYERLFKDIFKGADGRQLYLFGSGNYTKRFLELYGREYEIAGILDNNQAKWGTELEGYKILSPAILKELPEDSYKVIICIKHYYPIIVQLREMGVRGYSVYDINVIYPRRERVVVSTGEEQVKKKYKVGYIAGVFDLFHIGHLNVFKRAKEQCEYLIVGVVTDERVMLNKKTKPYIPFEDRIEIVRSCKYVDEAVEIPTYNGDTDEAYYRYRFDVQFSGSDYENDPVWLAKKAFLQKKGADLVFFPYTQSTSSTMLKEKMKEGH